MANKKFSEFTVKTSTSDVDFVVGYDGTDNVRITPANLAPAAPVTSVNSLTGAVSLGLTQLDDVGSDGTNGQVLTTNGSGSFTFTTASGGASSLNGLSDVLIDTASEYVGTIPSSLSGNPQGNTTLGISAGNSMTTQTNSTFIGNEAGSGMTSYSNATAIGFQSLKGNGGGNSVAVGYRAGVNYTGLWSVFMGYDAGFNASSNYVVAIGTNAINSASGGTGSIAIGYYALKTNTASYGVSIGYQAGYSQTSGSGNTNLGYQAGYSNTTGADRVVIGSEAGKLNTGTRNVFVGMSAGQGTSSGGFNTVVGTYALYGDSAGSYNSILGHGAMATATGSNNTAVGYQAGNSITTGSNLTIIGYDADSSSATATNEITLGNSSVAALRCAVTSITSLSDERDKSEIKDLDYGLAFIDALQPREFVWDNRPETDKDGEEFYSANKGKKDFGFIAQEVRELDNDTLRLVYSENEEKLELSYGKLVPILVKAIQELKEEVELLKS